MVLLAALDELMPPPLPLPASVIDDMVLFVIVAIAVLPLPLLKCWMPPPSPLLELPVMVLFCDLERGQRVAKNRGIVDSTTSSGRGAVTGYSTVVYRERGPAGETAGSIENAAASGNALPWYCRRSCCC